MFSISGAERYFVNHKWVLFDFFLRSDDLLTEKVRINKTNIFPDWEEFEFVQMDRSHMVLVFPGKVEQPWRELSEINDQSDET